MIRMKPLGSNVSQVELEDGRTLLFSYQTPVAAHIPGRGWIKTEERYSRTTSKHIGTHASGAKAVPHAEFLKAIR